jgi:5,10-methylenetetrahydromethanopterin reductase
MRVSVRVPPFAPVPDVVDFTRRCEEAGFDGVGYLDSQMLNRDVFVMMAASATATRRVHLISAVTNPITRHVSTLAAAALSLDDIAPGRIEIWIGRGYSSLYLVGRPEAKTPQMREAISTYRRLVRGEWDSIPGVHSRLEYGGRPVPIYLAAGGPRTIRLAGEVADGILLAAGFMRSEWDNARGLIEQGARSAGRDPVGVDVCLSLTTCIRDTRDAALRAAGPLIALRLNDIEWLAQAGIDTHGAKMPDELAAMYPDPMHSADPERALDLAETIPLDLRTQIAEKMGLIGSPEDCIARLREVAAYGFRYVYMRTVDTFSFPQPEIDAYRTKIAAAVASMA